MIRKGVPDSLMMRPAVEICVSQNHRATDGLKKPHVFGGGLGCCDQECPGGEGGSP